MTFSLSRRARSFGAFLLVTSALSAHLEGSVHACNIIDPNVPNGALGAFAQSEQPWPRNMGFLVHDSGEESVQVGIDRASGRAVFARALDVPARRGSRFARVTELLPPGSTLTDGRSRMEYAIGDYVDENPPRTPQVASANIEYREPEPGCSHPQALCGGGPKLNIALTEPITDDYSPPLRSMVVVYLGATADAASTVAEPVAVLPASPEGIGMWTWVGENWIGSGAYVAVSAVDTAGNATARSTPVRVSVPANNSGGCSLSASINSNGRGVAWLAASVGLLWWRRRKRRMPHA